MDVAAIAAAFDEHGAVRAFTLFDDTLAPSIALCSAIPGQTRGICIVINQERPFLFLSSLTRGTRVAVTGSKSIRAIIEELLLDARKPVDQCVVPNDRLQRWVIPRGAKVGVHACVFIRTCACVAKR